MESTVLIGLQDPRTKREEAVESLNELALLVKTVGGKVVHTFIQKRNRIESAYLIGKGKVEEITHLVQTNGITTVIFDEELSPAQQRNLEDLIGTKILDRTRLILDIFAQRAKTKEGILQVELAQLTYLLPRLTGRGIMFSQQLGGIGTRGPGERELEYDRRHIRQRILHLEKEIEKVSKQREIQREKRKEIPVVAIVGYTNVGKSTLLNTLTKKYTAYVDDKLFATLDPTTRRVNLPGGLKVLFTDTVGFIYKLPHHLVTAFRATLEETKEADLLIHLIDPTHRQWKQQINVVNNVLKELGISSKPQIMVYNKIDLLKTNDYLRLGWRDKIILISALTGEGVEELLKEINKFFEKKLISLEVSIPYNKSKIISQIRLNSVILKEKYEDLAIYLKLKTSWSTANKLQEFIR
ncbi:MAG TPA: GTPase HflX, partial [Elusimicrobia bacterium]|jgi:GTP-binding protein HflX|nr:GTPase HflX [Elusimicrobiota bacterium]